MLEVNILYSIFFFIFAILTMKYKEKNIKRIFFESVLFFFFGLITIIYLSSNYFTGEGINETVISTLNLGLTNAGFKEYLMLIFISLSAFILLFIFSFFYYFSLKSIKIIQPKKIKAFLHNGFFILAFLFHPFILDMINLYKISSISQSMDFNEYYKKGPYEKGTNKKNLVYIYAESLEKSYFNAELFPNLTPNLSKLIKQNAVEFTNIGQTIGTGFTLGGMIASQCGVPLFTESHGNSMSGIEKFYPKAVCISDILKLDNYYLSFLKGASVKFSGADKFYKTHNFDSIVGKDELLKNIDKDYINGWGLYDDTLLDLAYEEFEKLSKTKDNFALFLLTLDTHHPNGQLSKSCSNDLYSDGSNPILNTVKCTDILVSNFIEKIQKSNFSKNTIIVLTSDHLAMRNSAYDILNKEKDRKNLFVVFDSENKEYKSINKPGKSLDISSTILSFLGKDIDIGLGRNLLFRDSIYTYFHDFDHKLNQWRKSILSLWEFPKLGPSLDIDLQSKIIKVNDTTFQMPILMKISQDYKIKPFFDFNADYKLYQLFGWSSINDKYIWIDSCQIINYMFDTNITKEYCLAQGLYGGKQSIIGLDSVTNYKNLNFKQFISDKDNSIAIQHKIRSLEDFKYVLPEYRIDFAYKGYPDSLNSVEGMSDYQIWGRWTDSRFYKNAKFTFNNFLPKDFDLEIELGPHRSNLNNTIKIRIGSIEQTILTDENRTKYNLEFFNVINSNSIEIISTEVKDEYKDIDEDKRKLGLSLVNLKLKEILP